MKAVFPLLTIKESVYKTDKTKHVLETHTLSFSDTQAFA